MKTQQKIYGSIKQLFQHGGPGLALMLVAACSGGTSQTDPSLLDGGSSSTSLAMKAIDGSAAQNQTQALVTTQGVTVDKALLNAKEVQLYLPYGMKCADTGLTFAANLSCEEELEEEHNSSTIEAKIKIDGPIVFDLVAGTSEPNLAEFSLPSGVYRKLKVKLEKGSNGELSDLTFIAQGSYVSSDTNSVSFDIKLSFSEEFEVNHSSGFQVREDIQNALVTTFDFSQWLDISMLDACLQSGDLVLTNETLVVDKQSGHGQCDGIHDLIKENIKSSMDCENENEHDENEIEDGHHSSDSSEDSSGDENSSDDHGNHGPNHP